MTRDAERYPHHKTRQTLQLRLALAYLAVLAVGSTATVAILIPRLRRVLRVEMYRGHSTIANTWDVLLPDVMVVNAVATAVVLVLAAAITVVLLATVQRAARRLARDLRAARDGGDPAAWEPLRRPREFRDLQGALADGVAGHRRRLEEIDAACVELLEGIRSARGAPPGTRDPGRLQALCERLRGRSRTIQVE